MLSFLFLYRRRAYRGCLLPLRRGFSFDLWILGFPLTGILPCPGCPPPFPVLGPPFFGTPFAVFGLTLSCRQSSSFLLFAVRNFQSLVTPLVIFWRLFCSSCAIPLRNIAIFALPGSPGQLFFGVVSFWLCAPPRSIGVPMLTRRFWPKCMIPLHIYALFTLAVTFGIDFCGAFLVAHLSLFNLEAL